MAARRFDPQAALTYAAAIARPRRVGSGEDEKVAAEIEERLRQWGYRVERQPFTFSTAPQAFLTGVVLSGMLLVVVILLTSDRSSALSYLAALALLMLLVAFMPLNRMVQASALSYAKRGRLKQYTTANLIAQLPLPDRSDIPHLFLVAHYDSKSQHMPITIRIALFMLTVVLGLLLAVLTLLRVPAVVYLPIGLLVLVVGAPLLFLDVGNASPGAIDNASGVGLVLHLAEVLAQQAEWRERLRITILIPSAEEWSLMGSVAFVRTYEQMLRQQAEQGGLHILNFDGIGVDGDLYYVGHSYRVSNRATIGLLAQVQAACRELNLPLKRFGFIGALFDHIPFAQRGFDAISLVTVSAASQSVHTPADSIDKLHVRGFDQAGRVALRVIEQMIK